LLIIQKLEEPRDTWRAARDALSQSVIHKHDWKKKSVHTTLIDCDVNLTDIASALDSILKVKS